MVPRYKLFTDPTMIDPRAYSWMASEIQISSTMLQSSFKNAVSRRSISPSVGDMLLDRRNTKEMSQFTVDLEFKEKYEKSAALYLRPRQMRWSLPEVGVSLTVTSLSTVRLTLLSFVS